MDQRLLDIISRESGEGNTEDGDKKLVDIDQAERILALALKCKQRALGLQDLLMNGVSLKRGPSSYDGWQVRNSKRTVHVVVSKLEKDLEEGCQRVLEELRKFKRLCERA